MQRFVKSSKRFTVNFVHGNPADTQLHNLLSKNKLFQKIESNYTSSDPSAINLTSPVTNKPIISLKQSTPSETQTSINTISENFPKWAEMTTSKRSKIIQNFGQIIKENREDLAQLLSIEVGKPISESLGEVSLGENICNWFAAEAKRAYGKTIPETINNNLAMTYKYPVGPVASITPWNFPSSMVTRKCVPALAAGCTVLLKPSEYTPLSALGLKILAEKSGIPDEVFQVVLSDSQNTPEIGKIMFTDPQIKAVSFTGSTPVGKILLKHAASTVKKTCMELGGNAPFIVFKSGNIRHAVEGLINSKFRNTGQVCIAPDRVLIHYSIYDEFIGILEARVRERCRFGVPEDFKTSLGPMIYSKAIPVLNDYVSDAVAKGADLVLGGQARPDLGENFFEPTILSNVNNEMSAFSCETFGPIVACASFTDEIEALKIANSGSHGLAAYIYSNDASQILRVSQKIETGMLGVNQSVLSTIEYPFGGVRESGLGKEGSDVGLESYLETKLVHWNYNF